MKATCQSHPFKKYLRFHTLLYHFVPFPSALQTSPMSAQSCFLLGWWGGGGSGAGSFLGIRVDLSRCTPVDATNHLHSLPTPHTPCCPLAEVTVATSFFTLQCTLRVSIALVKAVAQGAPGDAVSISKSCRATALLDHPGS